jgi:EAL domain-containing protein (putative c-di-GMP-specific phosphodiesterase class I)
MAGGTGPPPPGEVGDVQEILSALTATGVRIALGDFGTGYSTLVHLQRLNTDVLKIDRSFVEQISRSTGCPGL